MVGIAGLNIDVGGITDGIFTTVLIIVLLCVVGWGLDG